MINLLSLLILIPDWIFDGAFWGGFACGVGFCFVVGFSLLIWFAKDFRVF